MRSGATLSILLKECDVNLHIDEDGLFNAVIFDKVRQIRIATLNAKKLPALIKKCYNYNNRYKTKGIYAIN